VNIQLCSVPILSFSFISVAFSYHGILGYFIDDYLIALNLDTSTQILSVANFNKGHIVFSTTGRNGTVNPEQLSLTRGEGIIVVRHIDV